MNTPITLEYTQIIELCPQAPFHFDATLHKPDHFPSADNLWEPGIRWQTMRWQGVPLGLTFANQGTLAEPHIALTIWSQEPLTSDFLKSLSAEITYRGNLQMDLTEFTRRFASDPQLGPIIAKWRGMRPMTMSSLYEYLIIAIVLQNANVRRSVNMLRVLFEKYGTVLNYDGKTLACFWEPAHLQQATEQDLRDLKIGYRAKAIKRITDAFGKNALDEFELRRHAKIEQRQALLNLYGIGPASVGYILFDVFHQVDELQHISPWEQKIYAKLFFDADPDQPVSVDKLLELFDRRFGGAKMLAVHYIWEDLFWKRKHEQIEWLDKLIRL